MDFEKGHILNEEDRLRGEERKLAYRRAGARAMVFSGPRAYLERWVVQSHLPPGELAPRSRGALGKMTGGYRRCVEAIRSGTMVTAEEVAPWTPGFVSGLRMARGLVKVEVANWEPWQLSLWQVWPVEERGWLIGDMEAMSPCWCKVARSGWLWRGKGVSVSGFAAGEMPCLNDRGIDVLAGVIAGSRVMQEDGVWWLKVPLSCRGILDEWQVPCEEHTWRRWRWLALSPFWGCVFAPLLSPGIASGFLELARSGVEVGQCPVLPGMLWQMAMGGGWRGMPFDGALPFGRHGRDWCPNRSAVGLREIGMSRWGITRVRPEIRDLLVQWNRGLQHDVQHDG